jgi:hypothetical protein
MNALFVHIPKTAGGTITRSLDFKRFGQKWNPQEKFDGRVTFKHTPVPELPNIVQAIPFKFTFVRNPYDRAVSLWRVMEAHKEEHQKSFIDWLDSIKDRDMRHRIFAPQANWFEGVEYDFIGHYETLLENIATLAELLGTQVHNHFPNTPFWLNKSIRDRDKDYYDNQTRELVIDIYRRDFELLRYPT